MNAYIVGILVSVMLSFMISGVPVDVDGDVDLVMRHYHTSSLVETPWEGA